MRNRRREAERRGREAAQQQLQLQCSRNNYYSRPRSLTLVTDSLLPPLPLLFLLQLKEHGLHTVASVLMHTKKQLLDIKGITDKVNARPEKGERESERGPEEEKRRKGG